ncbi:MAG: hypothetical protein ACRDT0_15250 [Pseudonocardiaceae bacterium]
MFESFTEALTAHTGPRLRDDQYGRLLTVFAKTRMRESREVDRARRAMQRRIDEEHTADEGDEE